MREVWLDFYRGEEKIVRALALTQPIVDRAFEALMDGHHDAFHRVWTTGLYVNFAGAFRQEVIDPASVYQGTVRVRGEDVQAEYQSSSKVVPVSTFCTTVDVVPASSECSICLTEVRMQVGEQPVVVTECGHFFHRDCLGTWVVSSGMSMSNTCPTCRTVLCKSRERVHFTSWNREDTSLGTLT